jgi:hypothetical protein
MNDCWTRSRLIGLVHEPDDLASSPLYPIDDSLVSGLMDGPGHFDVLVISRRPTKWRAC